MNLTTVVIKTSITSAKEYKLIREIDFYVNDEKQITYLSLDSNHVRLDEDNRNIIFNDYKQFGYANKRMSNEKGELSIILGKSAFMKLLIYVTIEMTYENNMNEKNEMEMLADIFKLLY